MSEKGVGIPTLSISLNNINSSTALTNDINSMYVQMVIYPDGSRTTYTETALGVRHLVTLTTPFFIDNIIKVSTVCKDHAYNIVYSAWYLYSM